jgi:hypothetical protein
LFLSLVTFAFDKLDRVVTMFVIKKGQGFGGLLSGTNQKKAFRFGNTFVGGALLQSVDHRERCTLNKKRKQRSKAHLCQRIFTTGTTATRFGWSKRQCLWSLDLWGSLEPEYFNDNSSRSRPILSIEKKRRVEWSRLSFAL